MNQFSDDYSDGDEFYFDDNFNPESPVSTANHDGLAMKDFFNKSITLSKTNEK